MDKIIYILRVTTPPLEGNSGYTSYLIFRSNRRAKLNRFLLPQRGNGDVFNVVYSDVPQKKKELIKGNYEIEAKGTVAVKIIDMLGEELLIKV